MAQKEFRSLSQSEMQSLTKTKLHEHLGRLSIREREHQAEVVAAVCEVTRRKLYFDHGFTSLFDYMTKGLEFSNASAQRYIDAARLCAVVPSLNEDIARGEVNLSQVTIVAKTVRQKKKGQPKFKMESRQATELFEKIKGEDARSSQQIIAQELKLEIKEQETARVQANRSVRYEITLSEEQEALFQRIKELISHVQLNPSFTEVFEYLATEYRKRKDPLVAKGRVARERISPASTATLEGQSLLKQTRSSHHKSATSEMEPQNDPKRTHFHLEVQLRQEDQSSTKCLRPNWDHQHAISPPQQPKPVRREHIPTRILREVHRRDRSCRHRAPKTGRTCGSTYQLQIDHVRPVWAGGGNQIENLQLLCAVHNRLKYRSDARIKIAT